MPGLSKRLSSLKPSSTLAVTARQIELRRQGVDVVSMAAGEPDFDTPDHVKAAAIRAIEAGKTKYTEVQGIFELRQAVADKFARENGLSYTPEQVSVSNGGKQALYNAFMALLDEGDEVLIPAPYWVSYPEQVRLAGGVPVAVPTLAKDDYVLDPERLLAALTPRSKVIVLNSPGNPTGAVFPEGVIKAVAELAAERNLILISDEIYEHIIYGADKHVSPARFAPDHTLTVNGASKAFAMTGWRLGFAAGPAWLIKAMNSLQGQVTTNASTPAQYAALEALRNPDGLTTAFVEMARTAFSRRRDLIVKGLNDLGLPTPTPHGAFYALADATRIRENEVDAARVLLDEARVAVVPGTDFGAPGRVRFSYACSEGQITEALARIRTL